MTIETAIMEGKGKNRLKELFLTMRVSGIISLYNTVMVLKLQTNKKRIIVAVVLFLTMTVSAISTYYIFGGKSQDSLQILGEATASEPYELQDPPEDLNTLNILLLGYGGAGHEGGFLTDVIQIAHLDFEQSKITLISIPRDLWVNLPDGSGAKINSAFTLDGGPEVTKTMAQIITNLKIDYYIAVDFVGFKRAIGYTLGGIEVDVPETLHDAWYPIEGQQLNPCGMTPEEIADITGKYSGFELEKQFPCRYEELYFPKGLNKMEGGDALKYVRSRHGSTAGDFSRSQRQVAVLKGIREKLISKEVFSILPKFYEDVTKHVSSDISWEITEKIAPLLKSSLEFEIEHITLSTDNVFSNSRSGSGQFILQPKAGGGNWGEVHKFVKDNL